MAKQRRFSSEFKARVVLEVLSGAKTTAEVCREHNLSSQLLGQWRARFLEEAPSVFERGTACNAAEERIAELERAVGRLTLELEVAKKASSILTSALSRNGR